jgi:hypothetical protein
MATVTNRRRGSVKLTTPTEVLRESFRRGLNLTFQDVELGEEEARNTTNLILKGKGILTQRPGTANYFQAGSGKIRLLRPYYAKSGTREILSVTDSGYLVRKNSDAYTIIPGASYASGTDVSGVQIYNKVYISSISAALRRYDGTTLTPYTGISAPASLVATKASGATGAFTWSWRVSAESGVGETLASDPVTIANLPEYLSTTEYVTISWPSVTNAQGYVIYGRDSGNETYLTRLPATSTSWKDDGNNEPSAFTFPPEADFTAGPQGKHITTYKEKLVVYNLLNNPSRLQASGGGTNIDKFHYSKGGFTTDINKDDGEEGTGAIEYENKIIAFKDRSIYQVTTSYNSSLGIVEPTVQRITNAVGCVAPRTIVQVENDIFYVGIRPGGGYSLNSLGYEPNFAQVLRTAEISARVRPELESINASRAGEMFALYWKSVYWLFYPVGSTSVKCLGYDRERLAWLGPFDFPSSPYCGTIYYDSSMIEHLLYGGNDGYVTEISSTYQNDKGTSFAWKYVSPKEYGKDPFRLKTLLSELTHLRNVVGQVDVSISIEDTSGLSSTVANFTISAPQSLAGWGSFKWGELGFGSYKQANKGTSNSSEVIKFISINKPNVRSYQITISGTGSFADIVAVKSLFNYQAATAIPSAWRV